MKISFGHVAIGLLVLSLLKSGGGNAKQYATQQGQRYQNRQELNQALGVKLQESDQLDTLSKVALERIKNNSTMVVDCNTRSNTPMVEGSQVCLPNGTQIPDGTTVSNWLLDTGEVQKGRVTSVAKVVANDRQRALAVLQKRGGFK